jgi:hypothetical protein
MLVMERLWVRSCETVSAFLKRSADLNTQLLHGEVAPTAWFDQAGKIWTSCTREFWDPKEER